MKFHPAIRVPVPVVGVSVCVCVRSAITHVTRHSTHTQVTQVQVRWCLVERLFFCSVLSTRDEERERQRVEDKDPAPTLDQLVAQVVVSRTPLFPATVVRPSVRPPSLTCGGPQHSSPTKPHTNTFACDRHTDRRRSSTRRIAPRAAVRVLRLGVTWVCCSCSRPQRRRRGSRSRPHEERRA